MKKDKTVTEKHVLFWGSVFSNWSPATFMVEGKKFSNSEQYFMYQKAELFGDHEIAHRILEEGSNPKQAKTLGRKVRNFDSKVWDEAKFNAMYNAVKCKFDANEQLKKELMMFEGKTFVEASPIDKIWGIGLRETDPRADDESQWKGQNLLGKALTKLRDEYQTYDNK